MRISDWSSDVCSSDLRKFPHITSKRDLDVNRRGVALDGTRLYLLNLEDQQSVAVLDQGILIQHKRTTSDCVSELAGHHDIRSLCQFLWRPRRVILSKIGRASCRERVCQYV